MKSASNPRLASSANDRLAVPSNRALANPNFFLVLSRVVLVFVGAASGDELLSS